MMGANESNMKQSRTTDLQDIPDATGLTARDRTNLVGREEARNQAFTQDAIDRTLKCIDEATLARCKPNGG
jgi:hypothetical protein